MLFQPPQFIQLANGIEIIEVGSIRHAKKTANGMLDIYLHGQTSPVRLDGVDATGMWAVLSADATPTAALIQVPAPVVTAPLAPGQASAQTAPLTPGSTPSGTSVSGGIAGTQGDGDIELDDTPPATGDATTTAAAQLAAKKTGGQAPPKTA